MHWITGYSEWKNKDSIKLKDLINQKFFFGNNYIKIKLYRENKNMTQSEVAEILWIKPATISKYEAGTLEPNIESLKRLAELFEISVDELLNDEEKFDISKINVLDILREQKEMKLKGNLYHNTQITFAYNTNHIEGGKLT